MTSSTPSRSTTKASARERARARRVALDVERAQRDEEIESAAAQFFEATDQTESLREQIRENELTMTKAVEALLNLKERPGRIQSLLGIDAAEMRRLKPSHPRNTHRTAPSTDANSVQPDEGAVAS